MGAEVTELPFPLVFSAVTENFDLMSHSFPEDWGSGSVNCDGTTSIKLAAELAALSKSFPKQK